jgi:hypothetical protein
LLRTGDRGLPDAVPNQEAFKVEMPLW